MTPVIKQFNMGDQTVTIETGAIARQASAAVKVSIGDTVVLVTAVGRREAKPGQPFFPLTVNYQERFYAGGRIPGGFFKREGRPTEKETLTSRLIDRPIRPLFPKGFMNEVQVIDTTVAIDPQIDADIPALIGTSAALALSGMPFDGPIGAARVGYKDGQYLLNPTAEALTESKLNLVVAGTADAVLMVESEAEVLSEEVMLGAVLFGHEQMQSTIALINELVAEVGKPKWEWTPAAENVDLAAQVRDAAASDIEAAYAIADKQERQARLGELRDALVEKLAGGDEPANDPEEVKGAFGKLEKSIVRRVA